MGFLSDRLISFHKPNKSLCHPVAFAAYQHSNRKQRQWQWHFTDGFTHGWVLTGWTVRRWDLIRGNRSLGMCAWRMYHFLTSHHFLSAFWLWWGAQFCSTKYSLPWCSVSTLTHIKGTNWQWTSLWSWAQITLSSLTSLFLLFCCSDKLLSNTENWY